MMKRLEKTIYIFVIILCFIVHPLYGQEKSGIKLSNGVLWVNVSDEYKLCVYQAYENASESLKNILQENKPENWCVVIDIDDTALSTIQYEVLLESKGEEYSDETWIEWAVKDEGTPLPGSVEFTRLVKELGGRVVFITNTQGVLKEVTLDKLNNCGFSFDVCIFREGPYKDDKYKILRIKDVEEGTIQGYPEYKDISPQNIIMRIGDSSYDLYDITRYSFEDIKDRIGYDLIIIPNPMYGVWGSSLNQNISTVK